ncbi:MAG TPA: phospholipase D-like domain-containing protein [Vicinamibacterales bacterium]|nr:phospholipase D-like domain-containing protein [Vicinamibacterales bacterium]
MALAHAATGHQPYRGSGSISSWWHTIRRRYKWWQLALFVIGVIAFVSVMGALFFAVGNKPARIYTDSAVPPVGSPHFSTALAAIAGAPVEHGGSVAILNNGDEFVPALLQSISEATRTINFSVYIWSSGEISKQVLSALEKKQREGVTVRILLDGFGSIKVSDEDFESLIAAGGKVHKFRAPRFGKLTRFHRRNHRRAIVIDGVVGFTGGMAVSDVWLGNAQDKEHWRDVMFKVTGPLARSLQTAFVDRWVSSSGELLIDPRNYPFPAPAEAEAPGVEQFVHLASSPADDDQSLANFILLPILAARQSIYLASPYFIPDSHLQETLVKRARDGIDVRLLLPGSHTDNWITRASARARYRELLEAGARIYEYQPTFMHAKYAVIDGQWSIIGSPNLNSRSRQLDEENALGILDRPLAGQLHAIFFKDLQRAEQINLEQWQRRHPLNKLFESISRILDQQS